MEEDRMVLRQELLTGERALFKCRKADIYDSIFDAGESPLKESRDIRLYNSAFKWKYPLWYAENVSAAGCKWFDMARAGVWYSRNIEVESALIAAPKNFRRCQRLTLKDVSFTNASETLWSCSDVLLENVSAVGDYFGMGCENVVIHNLRLDGNYSFDGGKNIEVHNSTLMSKDAFWNCENVTVYDSYISGEYLGWNSKKLTFVNCTIESLQGMCYIDNLELVDCTLLNTSLAFEYCTVDATIKGSIDSIKNPYKGKIEADSIGEIIMDDESIDRALVDIICRCKRD